MNAADLMLELDSAASHMISRALFSNAGPQTRELTAEQVDQWHLLRVEGVEKTVSKVIQRVLHWHTVNTTGQCDEIRLRDCLPLSEQSKMLVLRSPVFAVLRDAVSIHCPLQHLLAKTLSNACHGNVDLSSALTYLSTLPTDDLVVVSDYSLRALCFANSIAAGLWRRNGTAVSNLLYNYNRPPLCRSLRDLDALVVQVLVSMRPGPILLHLFHRFNTLSVFSGQLDPAMPIALWEEYGGSLLKGSLQFLIQLFNQVPIVLDETDGQVEEGKEEGGSSGCSLQRLLSRTPSPLGSGGEAVEGMARALAREMVHVLASNTNASVADLEKCKALVGTYHTIGDALFDDVLQALCEVQDDGKNTKISLREDAYELVSPNFSTLNATQNETLLERLSDRLKARLSEDKLFRHNKDEWRYNVYCPLFLPTAMPIPHHQLTRLRDALFEPILVDYFAAIVEKVLASSTILETSLLTYIVHLCTLQVHHLEEILQAANETSLRTMCMLLSQLSPLIRALGKVWMAGKLKSELIYQHALGFVLIQLAVLSNHRGLFALHRAPSSAATAITAHINSNVYAALTQIDFPEELFVARSDVTTEQGSGKSSKAPETTIKTAAQRAMDEANER